jgi:hypothetical protein
MPAWLRLGISKVVQISIIPRCLAINPLLAICLQLSGLLSEPIKDLGTSENS